MDSFTMPSYSGPSRILSFNENCIGCNACVNVCPMDVMIPNPNKGEEPIVVFAEECWFCGGCVQECPRNAVKLIPPAKQRISTIWKRKDTGEEFRVGMKQHPEPAKRVPSGKRPVR